MFRLSKNWWPRPTMPRISWPMRPGRVMPTLREVQAAFAQGLLTRDYASAAPLVAEDAAIAPAERLGIYRNTFIGTLVQALRNTYPAVERLVGAEFFEGAATLFIGKHPPRGAYL